MAAAAYRSASLLTSQVIDQETGLITDITFDYSNKGGVPFSKIFTPEGASKWCKDRQQLWTKVQQGEKRVDGQYARDIDIALQTELTLEQNIELLSEFVQNNFVKRGMITDVNVHMDNENNPHAHILLTTRTLEKDSLGESAFGNKDRTWGDRAFIHLIRKDWADLTNKYFQVYGIDKSITHESYEARGLGFIEATIHEGAATHTENIDGKPASLERKETNQEIVAKNLTFIRDNPHLVLESLTKNRAIFTRADMAKALDDLINEIAFRDMDRTGELEALKTQMIAEYQQLFLRLTSSSELVMLCEHDLTGDAVFTTRTQLALEERLLTNMEALKECNTHAVKLEEKDFNLSLYDKIVGVVQPRAKKKLPSAEQRKAITHLAEGGDVSVLLGRPGTGKSTVMSTLVKAYQARGFNVIGAAYSADASINLAEAAGIETHTLAKWQYDWRLRAEKEQEGKQLKQTTRLLPTLGPKDIFIIDEASMVDVKTMDHILEEAKIRGAKVIFIGDNQQLSAIGQGGALEKLVHRVIPASLTQIYRQKTEVERTISGMIAQYRMEEAINLLEKQEKLSFASTTQEATGAVVDAYMQSITANPEDSVVMLAYGNAQVNSLNKTARERLLASGVLKSQHMAEGGKAMPHMGDMKIALGERIVALKNNRFLGVRNGQVGIVTAIGDNGALDIRWLGKGGKSNSTSTIDTHRYPHLTYGYALTTYKAQGKTYDRSFVLVDAQVGYESFNVMATRHREEAFFVIDQTALKPILAKRLGEEKEITAVKALKAPQNNITALSELVSRRGYSNFAHDYIGYDDNPIVQTIDRYIGARNKAADIYSTMAVWQEGAGQGAKIYDHPNFAEFIASKAERDQLAGEIVEGWQEYRQFVPSSLVNYRTLRSRASKVILSYTAEPAALQAESLKADYKALQTMEKVQDKLPPLKQQELREKASILLESHLQNQLLVRRERQQLEVLHAEYLSKQSELNVSEWGITDFKSSLAKIFKQDPDKTLVKWRQIKHEQGQEKAWEIISNKPAILGDLRGVGLGRTALTDARAEAAYLLKQLPERLKGYEAAIKHIPSLRSELQQSKRHIESQQKEIASLESHCLTIQQERHLINLTQEEHLQGLREIQAQLGQKPTTHFEKKQSQSQAQAQAHEQSAENIHDQLAGRAEQLAQELLPKFIGKPLERSHGGITCGSLSLHLSGDKRGLWYRFSSGDGGNLFTLIEKAKGFNETKEAVAWAKNWLGMEHAQQIEPIFYKQEKPVKDQWQVQMPVPEHAVPFDAEQHLGYLFKDNKKVLEDVYTYRNLQNNICGHVVRVRNLETGQKEALPVVYSTSENNKREGWRLQGFGENRPLYNEYLLAEHPDKPVLIVEGEKAANAAAEAYPEFNVLSWSGGANAYAKSNWTVLEGKEVTIWPDNDAVGEKAALGIQHLLSKAKAETCKIVNLKQLTALPEKWDLADSLPDHIHPYHITNLLAGAAELQDQSYKQRIISEYLSMRKNDLQAEDIHTQYTNLGEYLLAKDRQSQLLKVEEQIVQSKLATNFWLTKTDPIFIPYEAEKIYAANDGAIFKEATKSADIAHAISEIMSTRFQEIPKEMLGHVAGLASSCTKELLEEHKEWSKGMEVQHPEYQLPFALKMASILLKQQEQGLDLHDQAHIDLAKAKCIENLHQEMQQFEHHQQAQQQLQRSRHMERDM